MIRFDQFAEFIKEVSDAGSGRIYHYTRRAAIQIIQDRALKTTVASTSEIRLLPNGEADAKKYGNKFISFARSISASSFTNTKVNNKDMVVVFEFNKNRLAANHKFFSVNWMGPGSRGTAHDEAEDRLVTFKDMIPIDKALIGIHVYQSGYHIKKMLAALKNEILNHKATINNLIKSIEELKNKGTLSAEEEDDLPDYEKRLSYAISHLEDALRSQEEYRNGSRVDAIAKAASNEFPNVPVWLYSNPKHFNALRWSEADQLNPNLPNPSEEDEDEED